VWLDENLSSGHATLATKRKALELFRLLRLLWLLGLGLRGLGMHGILALVLVALPLLWLRVLLGKLHCQAELSLFNAPGSSTPAL